VLRLVTSGRASGVFDFALPFVAEKHAPQADLERYDGKLVVVNSEAERPAGFIDEGAFPNQYRFYVVAGTPHVPDPLTVASPSNRTTPATYEQALRAHFLQGHAWVQDETPPPPSTHLLTASQGKKLARDVNGNALSGSMSNQLVPRLPYVELGEARFEAGFRGTFDNVRTIGDLGFASHSDYLEAFAARLDAYAVAGYIIEQDAAAMVQRAALCGRTFIETYRDHYDNFVSKTPC
jgi:alpha/beta hydrolase family protein